MALAEYLSYSVGPVQTELGNGAGDRGARKFKTQNDIHTKATDYILLGTHTRRLQITFFWEHIMCYVCVHFHTL